MRNKGLSFYKKKKKISQELLREIFSWIFGIALSVFLAAVVVIFLGKSTRVVGMSMEPTLENGQQIFIDRFLYVLSSPKAGDVVAFLPNGNENSHYYVKRVVAGPGDKDRGRNSVCQRAGKQMGDGTDPGCGYSGKRDYPWEQGVFLHRGQPE